MLAYAVLLAGEPEAEPGPAFAAMAPPYEPDGIPSGVLLLNRLGTLRYHRADAHAAAWTAAGHTATSLGELPDGPERRAIELETDRRAAGPYSTLTADERLGVLADLAALPGSSATGWPRCRPPCRLTPGWRRLPGDAAILHGDLER